MNEFPKQLTGNALQQLHEKAARTISEKKIGYYRNMFYSMANFYGIIPVKKVYEIFTDNYGEALSEESFLDLCEFFRYEQKNHFYIFGKEEYYESSTTAASEPKEWLLAHEVFVNYEDAYEQLMSLKKGKPWYILSKEMMGEYENELKIEKNEPFNKLINFLFSEFGLSTGDAEYKAEDAIHALKMEDHTFDDFLNELQRMGIDMSFEQVKKLVPYYIELNNNTRMSANNGYTPAEMEKMRDEFRFTSDSLYISEISIDEAHERERTKTMKKQMKELDKMRTLFDQLVRVNQGKNNLPVKSKKIGRNDPCPCGSGKKYKKCCGK